MGDVEYGESKYTHSPLTKADDLSDPTPSSSEVIVEYNKRKMKTVKELEYELEEYDASEMVAELRPNCCDNAAAGTTWLTCVLSLFLFIGLASGAKTTVGSRIMSFLAIMLALTAVAEGYLISATNGASISSMVAQRWKAVSYIATIMMITWSVIVAILLVCVAAVQDGKTDDFLGYTSVFMPLSIFFCLFILFVPLPVNKVPYQLEMIPLSDAQRSKEKLSFYSKVTKETHYTHTYRLTFLGCRPEMLTTWHCTTLLFGYILGLVSEILQIRSSTSYQSPISVLTYVYMVWAAFNGLMFTIGITNFCGLGCNLLRNHATFACQMTFLLSHFMSMALFLVNSNGLVEMQ